MTSRVCALCLGLLLGSSPRLAWASAGHVESRCPRLSQAEYEELDARVQLLLKGEERGQGELPAVVCTSGGAHVEWGGRRYEIVGGSPIVDEVVDIVEGVLHDEARRSEADPRTAEESAVAAGRPMLERGAGSPPRLPSQAQRADPIAVSSKDARGGGISLGFEIDMPSRAIGPAIGPAFDFGASVGPLLLGGREAIRFTTSGSHRQLSFMDFQGTVAYGAPFNPDRRWGVVARFGAEWMIAYPEGNSSQATVVPITDVGLRVAHSFGSVSVWLGLDAHFRLEPLRLRTQDEDLATQVSPSLTLGVAFVDWSRK